MKVGEVKSLLLQLWEVERDSPEKTSVLLLGAPGVGKSMAVREAAREFAEAHGKEFVRYSDDIAKEVLSNPDRYFVFKDLRLTEMAEEDASGVPRDTDIIDWAVTYKPFLWARVLSKVPGVLFIDELTNENDPNKLGNAYKMILDRAVGDIMFGNDVYIVAAGNSPKHSSIANMVPAPLINRLIKIEVVQPTVDEWKEWMLQRYGDAWDIRVFAFLKAFESENYLIRLPEEPEVLDNFPTPRTWSKLAVLLKKGINHPEVIDGLIGPEVGIKFRAFINSRVDIDDLVAHPEKFSDLSLDQKYMAALMLANYRDFKKASGLLKAMHSESPEYVVVMLLCMDKEKRTKAIQYIMKIDRSIFSSLVEVVQLKSSVQR